MNKQQIGSMTAKGGFLNEHEICRKFLNYKNDNEAILWLQIMGYEATRIQTIWAEHIPVRLNSQRALSLGVTPSKYEESIKYKKADIQIRISITIDNTLHIENISLKKANKSAGFNQVDKRCVSHYKKMWNFNDEIEYYLKLFTGEILPKSTLDILKVEKIRDHRRVFFDEIQDQEFQKIVQFFSENIILVVTDILRGRGGLTAEWFLVTRQNNKDTIDWILKDINTVCNFYAKGKVEMIPKGSLKIGRITMQRKGGTPDPTSLQFKINPLEIFDI